jgi:type IV pilus assembly protein PilF
MSIDVETSVVLSQGPQEGELDRRDPARVLFLAVVLPLLVPRSQMNAPLAQRFVLAALGAACALACGACGAKNAQEPGAQSAERQSESEYDLARDSFYKGSPRAALDHALKAVQLDEENAKALYFTSTVYLWFCSTDAGLKSPDCRLADADAYARKALKADESFRDARNLLGQILILEKKYDEAIATLEPLTKDPAYTANYLAWGNLGWAQVLSGQIDAGIASLRNAITQPRFCVGHYRLGIAFEKKGDMVQADKALTDAISVESPDCQSLQDAWEARARVRMKVGKVAEARADYQRCREISADSQIGKTCAQVLEKQLAPAAAQNVAGGKP